MAAASYIVRHAVVNVWDSSYDLADAKKERSVKRLRKGDEVSATDLKHADVKSLLDSGAIIKKSDAEAPVELDVIPAGSTQTEVPEDFGPVTPEAH